jgi:hypothetical protein
LPESFIRLCTSRDIGTGFWEFLQILADQGVHHLSLRLDRGEV